MAGGLGRVQRARSASESLSRQPSTRPSGLRHLEARLGSGVEGRGRLPEALVLVVSGAFDFDVFFPQTTQENKDETPVPL